MELTPRSGILQPPVALISPNPCSTSWEPPGTLRNLLMRSNYWKFQVFNQLWMHGWKVQLNPLRKCTLNKISDELHTWFPCCFPTSNLLPLSNHLDISIPAPPSSPHLPTPRALRLPPCFKNCRTNRALQTSQPGWFLSKPFLTLICGFLLGVLERLFLAISTLVNC